MTSSWFGNGLSQITGQISNFTKEVLEEGTEEVNDHVTELKLTKKHLSELDHHSQALRGEIERLKSVNEDLEEKLQASDLQSNTLSREYRELLSQKEAEIKSLKLQRNELSDQGSGLFNNVISAATSSSPSSSVTPSTTDSVTPIASSAGLPHSSSAPSLSAIGISEDHDELSDVISTQYEINRLRTENKRLETESRQWREAAQQGNTAPTGDAPGDSDQETIGQLQTRLKEVQQQYNDEVDNHQRELAALHDVHAQKVSTLKRKHREELQRLQQNTPEHGKEEGRKSSERDSRFDSVSEKLQHLEKINSKLTYDLELTHAADREKANRLQDLQETVKQLHSERDQMTNDKSLLAKERDELMHQLDSVVSERRQMSERAGEMTRQLADKDQALQALRKQSEANDSLRFMSSTPIKPRRPDTEGHEGDVGVSTVAGDISVSNDNNSVFIPRHGNDNDSQTKDSLGDSELRAQLAEYEAQVEQFQLVKADWQMEKEALEDVLLRLREELRTKEEQIDSMTGETQSQGQADDTKEASQNASDESPAEASLLEEKLRNQTSVVEDLSAQLQDRDDKCEELQRQIARTEDSFQDIMEQLNNLLAEKSAWESRGDESERVELLESQVSSLQNELAENETRRRDTSQELEASRAELSEVQTSMNRLSRDTEKRQEENEAEKEALRLDVEEAKELREANRSLTEERDGLLESLEELDAQHQAALEQMIEQRQEIQRENEQLRNSQKVAAEGGTARGEKDATKEENSDELNQLRQDLGRLKAEREKVAVTLNDLHMAKEELTEAKAKLKEEKKTLNNRLNEVTKERNQLKQTTDRLERDVQEKNSALTLLKTEMIPLRQLETTNASLKEQLEEKLRENEQRSDKIAALSAGKDSSRAEEELENVTTQKNQLQLDNRRLIEQAAAEKVEREELRSKLVSFESSLQTAESKLSDTETRLSAKSSQLDAKTSECEKLLRENDELQTNLHSLSAATDQQISQLKSEKESLSEKAHRVKSSFQGFKSNMSKRLQGLQKASDADIRTLHAKLALESDGDGSSQVDDDSVFLTDIQEILGLLLTRAEALSLELSQRDVIISELKTSVVQNQQSDEASQRTLDPTENIHSSSSSPSQSNRERLKDDGGTDDQQTATATEACDSSDKGTVVIDHSSTSGPREEALDTEIAKLREDISQKDTVISQLNDNNSSLLQLLEERSLATVGDKSLVDLYHVQNESRSLRAEKDQMMSVLNEKTRECSSLKAELRRLMNVVSAEKSALAKLQSDNEQLSATVQEHRQRQNVSEKTAVHGGGGVSEDDDGMTREAVKRLSQIIRDKDLEIESLGQKNTTLLQVLQESGREGAQISSLTQERDNLTQQIRLFQSDRESLVSALNAKHAESVAYHGEAQRLAALAAQESQRAEGLHDDLANVRQQFEMKQQALVKLQNEAVNLRRKCSEAEARLVQYREARRSEATLVNGVASAITTEGATVVEDMQGSTTVADNREATNNETPTNAKIVVAEAQNGQLSLEVQDLRRLLQATEDALTEKDRALTERESALREKDRALLEKSSEVTDRERSVGELTTRIRRLDDSCRAKDSEIGTLKKQCENVTFQLQGAQSELSELRQDREQLQHRSSVLQQELGAVRDENNKLTISLNDKDFEITASREKSSTLTKLIQEQGEGEKGEIDRLMREKDESQRQVQAAKQERDQALLALQQQQAETQQLKNEIQRSKEKHAKQVKELDRLRGHLLSIEDTYTQEALAAEEREKDLRNKLVSAEERALNSSTAVQNANQQALEQLDSVQTQLHTVAGQRDRALLQLASAQETANQYATSLQNLQMVLEQFQMEKETQQNMEIERYQKEISACRHDLHQLREKNRELQAQVNETTDALEAAQRLSEQLDRKEQMIAALREEVQLREAELSKAEDHIRSLSVSREAKVDKELVKNLILGYFHTPAAKRREALQLIGRMLDFDKSDMEQLGETPSSGWLRGFFKKSSPTPPSTPKHGGLNQSFSELFVTFLERESSPKPSLRLPTERMVTESQRRSHQHTHSHPGQQASTNTSSATYQADPSNPLATPANPQNKIFNPFAAPVATTSMPLHVDTSETLSPLATDSSTPSSHPLIKPLAPSLPMFANAGSNLLVAPSMAGDPFYHAAPTNSGAILRDVLQQ